MGPSCRTMGDSVSGGGGIQDRGPSNDVEPKNSRVGSPGGEERLRVRYDAHPRPLFLQDRDNLRILLMGALIPTLYRNVL